MKCLLACIDFSDETMAVVETAFELGAAVGAKVVLLHVGAPEPDFVGYDPGPQSVRDQVASTLRQEHRDIEALAAKAPPGVTVQPLMVQGSSADAILEQADRLDADMIVLASHGHGALYDLLVGSVAKGVLAGAKIPVMVVPRKRESD